MRLAIVRHGRTVWNDLRIMQGRSDIPLDEEGLRQAAAAAGTLDGGGWTRVVCSPLRRAQQTAEIIALRLGLPAPIIDDTLVERDFGVAEGMPVREAAERWPDGVYPGAEPWSVLAARGAGALARIGADGDRSVVVAHGTLLRASVEQLSGAPFRRILNGEVLDLSFAGDRAVVDERAPGRTA